MDNLKRISCGQLVCLLSVSRIFQIFTYVPDIPSAATGSVMLLALPLSFVMVAAMAVPAFLFIRMSGGDSYVSACKTAFGKVSGVVTIGMALLFAVLAAQTAGQMEYFMSSAIYPGKGKLTFFLVLTLVAVYFVYMHIEPIARGAGVVMALVVLALVVMFLNLTPKIDILNAVSPFYDGTGEILSAVVKSAFSNLEVVALLVMLPFTTAPSHKVLLGYQLTSLAIVEAVTFFTLTVLGDYAATNSYPVYALSSVSGFSFIQGLDSLYSCIWVFVALIRTAFCLFISVHCLNLTMNGRFKRSHLPICSALVLTLGLALTTSIAAFTMLYKMVASPIVMCIALLAVPLLGCVSLLIRRGRGKA